MPFAVLVLGACLLMTRIARDPRGARLTDPRVIGLGVLLGLAALTRNEALWLALAWASSRGGPAPRPRRAVRLIGVAGVVAVVVFAPWAFRDWLVFGSPLPGQAVTNALSVTGFDIFAWNDPPTLARYLAVGPARLLEMRVDGLAHNLFNVLLLPGLPISLIGLLALPWQGRDAALRPVLVLSVDHVPRHQPGLPGRDDVGHVPPRRRARSTSCSIVVALLALDAGIARLGARLGWTRPVAWLGPPLGDLRSVAVLRRAAAVLRRRVARDGRAVRGARPADGRRRPAARRDRRAGHHRLPDLAGREPARSRRSPCPTSRPRTSWTSPRPLPGHALPGHRRATTTATGRPSSTAATGAECFRAIDLGAPAGRRTRSRSRRRAFEIVCP